MQLFDGYERRVTDAVDGLFGEIVRIEPRADGAFQRAANGDLSRPPIELKAIVDFNPAITKSRIRSRSDTEPPNLAADKLHVSIDAELLPYELFEGDVLIAISRPQKPAFTIASPEPDGLGRIVFRCYPGRNRE